MTTREWAERLYKHLKENLPPPSPVRLRWTCNLKCDGKPCLGLTTWGPKGVATIQIGANQNTESTVDTLRHEYSHVLDGSHYVGEDVHPDSWGKHYSRVYREWERFLEMQP